MYKYFYGLTLPWLMVILTINPAIADKLDIPNLDDIPPNSSEGVPRPVRAMSMDEVEAQFGQPLKVYEPIGTPPITRWEYEKFIVHFEYQYVINSVVKRKYK